MCFQGSKSLHRDPVYVQAEIFPQALRQAPLPTSIQGRTGSIKLDTVDQSCAVGPQHAAADPAPPTGYLAVKYSIVHQGLAGYGRRPHGRSMLRPYNWRCRLKQLPNPTWGGAGEG
ncbi:MAG: hypothetical protein QNJ45_13415 [Ardenticatenaceae bacterium]|nr:hypothetical protein [Ardenticatenaceae bacterium]